MSKNRIKKNLPTIRSREEAEARMNDLASTANNRRRLVAQRDAEVLAINSKFEGRLATCEQAIDEATDALRVWAESFPEEFPKGRKSLELVSGTLGFRTGTPKLALLSRAWTWEKVTEAVQRWLPNFIREKPEVDKENILNQREELEPLLARCGVKVLQGESFFIEPKLSDMDARQTSEVAA